VSDYKIRLEGQTEMSGNTVLKISAPLDLKSALYICYRNVKSIKNNCLGQADKYGAVWYYFLNTINIPNGDYEFFAQTRINNTFVQSNALAANVNNPASPVLTEPLPPTIDTTTKSSTDSVADKKETTSTPTPAPASELAANKTADAATQSARTFAEARFDEASTSVGILRSSSSQINDVFASYRSELDDVLKRYAVARQSGDQVALRTVEQEFAKLKEKIQSELLADPEKNALADNVGVEFDNRLAALKKRIDTFEKLRHTAGAEDIGVDSDGDGISDYDERNLYHTDGHSVDTDGDGYDDGIEIMRGYDPRSPKGEAAVAYEQPQDTVGLEDNKDLRIETVIPSVKQVSDDNRVVQSEIRGKALPNSFVTLYIFSTPTVVTVKTDNDGSFVYTFEKELEDGNHEVYAAITDNTGAIIVQSTPFKFVKQAEAFTPVGSSDKVNTVTLADLKHFEMFKTVIGLGILGFGIILIMLGFNLRGTRRGELNNLGNDIKAS
jgi:hypothetical protein